MKDVFTLLQLIIKKRFDIWEAKEFVQNVGWRPLQTFDSSFYSRTGSEDIKETVSSNWKEFGKDTWLVKLKQYTGTFQHIQTEQIKHGFIHHPCPKGEYKAFGEAYGLYEGHTCEKCGNKMPREARDSDGYVQLMNAVQKYEVL